MKKILILLTLISPLAIANDLKIIDASLWCQKKFEAGPIKRYEYNSITTIQNQSKNTLRVPTGNFSTGYTDDNDLLEINYEILKMKTTSGLPIVRPESKLDIVVLKPNEVAQIYQTIHPRELIIKSSISINVDKEIAQRFNTWTGLLKFQNAMVTNKNGCTP